MQCQKFDLLCQHEMQEGELIRYAGFLYDQNPTFLMLITISPSENCSYLSLGKIQQSEADLEQSEQIQKQKLMSKLQNNPYSHKLLQKHEGQMNMTLQLTPQTLQMLNEPNQKSKEQDLDQLFGQNDHLLTQPDLPPEEYPEEKKQRNSMPNKPMKLVV